MIGKYILLFLIILGNKAFSQSDKKQLDFILVIDEKVAVGSIANLKIKIVNNDNNEEFLEASYFPGNLSIREIDYDRLVSDDTKEISLLFKYSLKTDLTISYDIIIEKAWVKSLYNVLYVYNLNKKPYKNWWKSKKQEREYLIELDSPGNTFRVIRDR